ncbi:MAG: hypothetical protein QOC92_4616 [Acidimicrobiaceae bacterium]|jgi:hypothetical protein
MFRHGGDSHRNPGTAQVFLNVTIRTFSTPIEAVNPSDGRHLIERVNP